MSTFLGIALDNWANIDGDCSMTCEIVQREIQIEIGHSAGSLHLVLTRDALIKLARLTDAALSQVHVAAS